MNQHAFIVLSYLIIGVAVFYFIFGDLEDPSFFEILGAVVLWPVVLLAIVGEIVYSWIFDGSIRR